MQTRLKELGYDLGKYGIDGDFGSDTQAAVMKFQTDNGLEATGVYDIARRVVAVRFNHAAVREGRDAVQGIIGVPAHAIRAVLPAVLPRQSAS